MDCLQNITPRIPFDFDQDSLLGTALETIGTYGNIGCNDCVIAARAHHTIRLVWTRSKSVPDITDTDVLTQYHNETGNPNSCQDGIILGDSLQLWKGNGWEYGGTMHSIDDCCGPFRIDGCLIPSVPTMWPTLTRDLLRAGIYVHSGAQINLTLPVNVKATDSKTFGQTNPWTTMFDRSGDDHVMLLTGYDVTGAVDNFSGITWGQKQTMTWEFLRSHCWGVFFVQGGQKT